MPTIKPDTALTGAVDLARTAAESIAEPGTVGDHLRCVMEGERLATHEFVCLSPGYPDWRWSITVTRVSRSKHVTVSETHLLPSETSIVAPPWVPYEERIKPGDLGVGDVNPYVEDDPNLEPGFEATGDEDVDSMAQWELGLGRKRVLSAEGREGAAQRWYDGANGPEADVAKQAPARCSTCGYFLPMAGALRRSFGVCANEWSPSDGRVVSLDHGCGAHSEVDMERPGPRPLDPPVVDDLAVDLEVAAPAEVPDEPAQPVKPAAEGAALVLADLAKAADQVAADIQELGLPDETEEVPALAPIEAALVSASSGVTGAPEEDLPPVVAIDAPAEEPARPRRGRRGSRRAAGAPAGPPRSTVDASTAAAAQHVAEMSMLGDE